MRAFKPHWRIGTATHSGVKQTKIDAPSLWQGAFQPEDTFHLRQGRQFLPSRQQWGTSARFDSSIHIKRNARTLKKKTTNKYCTVYTNKPKCACNSTVLYSKCHVHTSYCSEPLTMVRRAGSLKRWSKKLGKADGHEFVAWGRGRKFSFCSKDIGRARRTAVKWSEGQSYFLETALCQLLTASQVALDK